MGRSATGKEFIIEEQRLPGRTRRRWGHNSKMEFQEVGCGVMVWIEIAQDWDTWQALVNAVMNLQIS